MSTQPWTMTSYPKPQHFPANAWKSRSEGRPHDLVQLGCAVQMAYVGRITESWAMRSNPRPWVTRPASLSYSRLRRSRVVNPSIHRSPQAHDVRPSGKASSSAGASASCVS